MAASASAAVVPDKPLPPLNRYFAVPSDMSSRGEQQSFTSLADLFDNPAVSVLKDAAGLRSATLMAVEDERRLLGTLAHRLVEVLFAIPGALTWNAAQVRAWLDKHADELIEAEGAPLLMLGFSIVLHRFKSAVREGNAVCNQLLQRYCFELGHSPDQTVLSEVQSVQMLRRALEEVLDPTQRDALVQLGDRFDLERSDWDKPVAS